MNSKSIIQTSLKEAARVARDYQAYFYRPEWIDFALEKIHPLLSVEQTRARVEAILRPTANSRTLILKTGPGLKPFAPGQFALFGFEIDGRREQRPYSLMPAAAFSHLWESPRKMSLPGRYIAITVWHQAEGRVSTYIKDELQPGDLVTISQAAGDFLLPDTPESTPARQKLTYICAGSGITPVFSHLTELARRRHSGPIELHYGARSPESMIFYPELVRLARSGQLPGLKMDFYFSGGSPAEKLPEETPPAQEQIATPRIHPGRRIDPSEIGRREGAANSRTYVCGPPALVAQTREVWQQLDLAATLISEQFGPAPLPTKGEDTPAKPVRTEGKTVTIHLETSGRKLEVRSDRPLLNELEDQGIGHPSGCRMGICHTCICRKVSGIHTNTRNGEEVTTGDQEVQLCVSAAGEGLRLEL